MKKTKNQHAKTRSSTQRSDKRKAELQAAAVRDGFAKWSEAITAWKNGNYVLTKNIGKK